MQTFIAAIFILLNIFSFGMYAYDKMAAKSGRWRISEKSLLTISILGGCFGGTLAMYLLRHKTQHMRFILVNWIADAVYLVILLALLRQ
jgi:uncharacterized membrane protein YsdA (DUF1294 family)